MSSPQVIGPVYRGSRLRIENPAAGRASRNVQSLVPRGYRMIENHGSYIIVTPINAPKPPPGYNPNKSPAANQRASQPSSQQKPTTAPETVPQEVWLDGRLVTIKVGPDGQTYTATPVKGGAEIPGLPGSGQNFQGSRPTAFDALDGQAIDPTAPFLMNRSTGPRPTGFVGPVAIQPNHMTVSGGVQWLAELSTKDPGSYQAMLQKLYSAGYLTKKDLLAAGGRWSAAAGQAMALAARDTAVVNTTTGGLATTLDDLLQSKAGAASAAEAEAAGAGKAPYVPTERRYTDPADIKASAKSEAEKVLGRQLTDAEEAELVGHFRSLENAAYDQIDAAQGHSYRITPPGMGQVDAYVEDGAHEQEAANFRAAGYGQALKRLFGVATGG